MTGGPALRQLGAGFYFVTNSRFFSLQDANMKTGGKGTNKDTKKDDYKKGGKGSGNAKGGKGK